MSLVDWSAGHRPGQLASNRIRRAEAVLGARVHGSADILVRALGRSRMSEHFCHGVIVGARADGNVRAPWSMEGGGLGHAKDAKTFALAVNRGQNCSVNIDWNELREMAAAEIEATLAELPKPLCEQARKLPVTFERRPNSGLQADGIQADTLGLFTGSEFADAGAEVLPAQIILFLENLWDFAEGDSEVYADEVHTTFLHELGHFFGLGEDDLTERGLE